MPASICGISGCPRVATKAGRCEQHQRPDRRTTAAQRGYGAAWQRVRARVLRADPTCTACGLSASTVVHHLDLDPTNNNDGNLLALCRDCHERLHGRTN